MQSRKKGLNQLLSLILATAALLFSTGSIGQVSEEWVRKFKGRAEKLEKDAQGNVYITGSRVVGQLEYYPNYDIITAKYNAAGDQEWISFYKGSGNSADLPEDIKIDKEGNVYVTGWIDRFPLGESNQEWATIKYNSQGQQQWARIFDTTGSSYDMDVAHAIAIDDEGNVYVTGESIGMVTIKYNAEGERQWLKSYPGNNFGEDIVVDAEGNSYVFGTTMDFGPLQYFLIKYSTTGVEEWKRYTESPGCINCLRNAIALDNNSNINIISKFGASKYDSDGNLLWKQQESEISPTFTSIQVDSLANVYLSGTFYSGSLQSSAVTVKYDNNGNRKWINQYNYGSGIRSIGYNADIDKDGNTYVAVYDYISTDSSNIVTIKYDSSGVLKWEQRYVDPDQTFKRKIPYSIKADNHGNVYVVGNTSGQETLLDIILIKYSQQTAKHGLCCFDNGLGPQAVCGTHVTPLNCYRSGKNAFFAGYVDDCEAVDTIAICNKNPSSIRINAEYLEDKNSVRLSWNKESAGQTPGYYIQRSKDGTEFKTIGYVDVNAAGQYQFNDPYPEIENHYKIVWFEPKGYESNKVLAVALAKEKIQVFPNPTTNKVRIVLKELEEHNSNLIVTDDMGRVKLSRRLFKGTTPELEVSNFPAGIYVIRIEINGKIYRQRFVKR